MGRLLLAILSASAFLGSSASAQTPQPEILSPAPGTVVDAEPLGDGAIMRLMWSSPAEANVEDWAIYVGSTPGAWDYQRITHMNRYFKFPDQESLKIGVPADGSTFYVRLFWRPRDSGFSHLDVSYVAPDFSDIALGRIFSSGFE